MQPWCTIALTSMHSDWTSGYFLWPVYHIILCKTCLCISVIFSLVFRPSLALSFDHCNCKRSRTGAREGPGDTTSQRKQISHYIGWLQDLLRCRTDSCQLEPKRWRILTDLGPESFGWVCGASWRSPTVALLKHCMWCHQRRTGDGEWGVSFPGHFRVTWEWACTYM